MRRLFVAIATLRVLSATLRTMRATLRAGFSSFIPGGRRFSVESVPQNRERGPVGGDADGVRRDVAPETDEGEGLMGEVRARTEDPLPVRCEAMGDEREVAADAAPQSL
jgi:hypothetical protein